MFAILTLFFYLLASQSLIRWATTVSTTKFDSNAWSPWGLLTLSSWFNHACITCCPNSSLLQESFSLSRVLAIRPNLRLSFQNLPRMRLVISKAVLGSVCIHMCVCVYVHVLYICYHMHAWCVCPHVSVTLVWWEVVITHHLLETQMDTGTTTTTAPAK